MMWVWLVVAMVAEAVLLLWFAAKTWAWGYEDGAAAVRKALDECRKKEQAP